MTPQHTMKYAIGICLKLSMFSLNIQINGHYDPSRQTKSVPRILLGYFWVNYGMTCQEINNVQYYSNWVVFQGQLIKNLSLSGFENE